MSRPSIPAELKRAILVEAGHRCAIPRCGQTEIDIHHIVPWETCKKHEYDNLIALCPVCHRRAHKGEIDRKSLQQYKFKLSQDSLKFDPNQFSEKIIEIKRCISEVNEAPPGYDFNFEFPDFNEPSERIASKNIEAWGNELLVSMRQEHLNHIEENKKDYILSSLISWLRGKYEIIRRDPGLISIKYTIIRYVTGAAHRGQSTRVQNFLLNPFTPVTLDNLIIQGKLVNLSDLVREKLLLDSEKDESCVKSGTQPNNENFQYFNLHNWGVVFTFPEYQIDCYAAGEQNIFVGYDELDGIFTPEILSAVKQNIL